MMDITEFIPVGSKNAISRSDLRLVTGLNDRELRKQINHSNELIINMQDGEGYFIPSPEDYHLVLMWERTFWKRIRDEIKRATKGKMWREERERECDIYCQGIEEDDV